MNTEPKPVEERDTLDLLELVCQLHSRVLSQPRNKNMHDAYVEARQEMERRIKVNNNFVLADEYTKGYRDGWRDCCKDQKEFD